MLLIVLPVTGAIVAVGLLLLSMWKVYTSRHDRREYAKFKQERQNAKWGTVRSANTVFLSETRVDKNISYGKKRGLEIEIFNKFFFKGTNLGIITEPWIGHLFYLFFSSKFVFPS